MIMMVTSLNIAIFSLSLFNFHFLSLSSRSFSLCSLFQHPLSQFCNIYDEKTCFSFLLSPTHKVKRRHGYFCCWKKNIFGDTEIPNKCCQWAKQKQSNLFFFFRKLLNLLLTTNTLVIWVKVHCVTVAKLVCIILKREKCDETN